MRTLLVVALGLMCLAPQADAKPRRRAASADRARAAARVQADRRRAADEAARAEAELAEVRSGKLTQAQSEDRDFPTQQLDDGEVPPGTRGRR